MFAAVLFTIAKRWKQPTYPSAGEGEALCVCPYRGYYRATERHGAVTRCNTGEPGKHKRPHTV